MKWYEVHDCSPSLYLYYLLSLSFAASHAASKSMMICYQWDNFFAYMVALDYLHINKNNYVCEDVEVC